MNLGFRESNGPCMPELRNVLEVIEPRHYELDNGILEIFDIPCSFNITENPDCHYPLNCELCKDSDGNVVRRRVKV